MIRIPRFSSEEVEAIVHLLGEERIPFELEGATTGVSRMGASTEFYLLVDEEHFTDVISLLVIYFQITSEEADPYEGTCPACGTEVKRSMECPDCGLSFSIETPQYVENHAFYKYLSENGLLPAAEEGTGGMSKS